MLAVGRLIAVVWAWLSVDPLDVVLFLGLALLGSGLYFVWPPLALIVPGAILVLFVGLQAIPPVLRQPPAAEPKEKGR